MLKLPDYYLGLRISAESTMEIFGLINSGDLDATVVERYELTDGDTTPPPATQDRMTDDEANEILDELTEPSEETTTKPSRKSPTGHTKNPVLRVHFDAVVRALRNHPTAEPRKIVKIAEVPQSHQMVDKVLKGSYDKKFKVKAVDLVGFSLYQYRESWHTAKYPMSHPK